MAASYENSLPSYLNISQNPFFNPSSSQAQGYINNQANQYYNQAVAPAVGSLQTQQYQTGMNNSSSGGAQLGQLQAEGEVASNLYGEQAYEGLLGGLNSTSQNYFQGPGNMASTNLGASNQYQQQGYQTASQNYQSLLSAGTGLGSAGKSASGGIGRALLGH